MSNRNPSYFRTTRWTRYYPTARDEAITQAAQLAAIDHPDVPGVSVREYRRLLTAVLVNRAQYHTYTALADGRTYHQGGLPLSGAQADAMAAHVEAANAYAQYVTGTLGWSLERAREIITDRTADHEERARELVGVVA